MPEVRPAVVASLVAVLVDNALTPEQRVEKVMHADATDDERSYAVGILAGLAATETDAALTALAELDIDRQPSTTGTSILDATYRHLQADVHRGVALAYVLDRLGPLWAPRPDTPLVDVIKILRADEVAGLAAVLHRVGITDLDTT